MSGSRAGVSRALGVGRGEWDDARGSIQRDFGMHHDGPGKIAPIRTVLDVVPGAAARGGAADSADSERDADTGGRLRRAADAANCADCSVAGEAGGVSDSWRESVLSEKRVGEPGTDVAALPHIHGYSG